MKNKIFFLLIACCFFNFNSCKQESNGYSDLNKLFEDFVTAIKSEDDDDLKNYIKKIIPDDITINHLEKIKFSYRGLPEGLEQIPNGIEIMNEKFLKKAIRFRDQLKRQGNLESLKFEKAENIETELIKKEFEIEANETMIVLKHKDGEERCKLGELLKIDGTWKTFTQPRF